MSADVHETIRWRNAAKERPSEGVTVLVHSKHASDSEPVWFGWYEEGSWFAVDGSEYNRGAITHWAEKPSGPLLMLLRGAERKPPHRCDALEAEVDRLKGEREWLRDELRERSGE